MTLQPPLPPDQGASAEQKTSQAAISRDIQRVVQVLDAGDDFSYFESRRTAERDEILTRWPLLADINGSGSSTGVN